MACLSSICFIILFAFAFHLPSSLEARNNILLVSMTMREEVPSSSGDQEVDAMAINESLIFSHLAKMVRLLAESVPSPGVGH
jgi:hypothetical protein